MALYSFVIIYKFIQSIYIFPRVKKIKVVNEADEYELGITDTSGKWSILQFHCCFCHTMPTLI